MLKFKSNTLPTLAIKKREEDEEIVLDEMLNGAPLFRLHIGNYRRNVAKGRQREHARHIA